MKKILLTIIVLSAFQLQARNLITDPGGYGPSETSINTSQYCSHYNETAIRIIYKQLAKSNLNYYSDLLKNHQAASLVCYNKLQNAIENDGFLTIQQHESILAQCDHAKILTKNELQKNSIIFNAIVEAKTFQNEDAYVYAYTTNTRMSCDQAYNNVARLSEILMNQNGQL